MMIESNPKTDRADQTLLSKYQTLIWIGLILLIIGLVILRWPRLAKDRVYVTYSEVTHDRMVEEYRMSTPFKIKLTQTLHEGYHDDPDNLNVRLIEHAKNISLITIDSKYDLLRGEYYVKLTLERKATLDIKGNDNQISVSSWSAPNLDQIKWARNGTNLSFSNGVVINIASLTKTDNTEESITLSTSSIEEN